MRALLLIAFAVILTGCASHRSAPVASLSNRNETTWELGLRLVDTARRHAASRDLDFSFERTESMVVVRPSGERAVAEVWFYSIAEKPRLQIAIDANGKPQGHALYKPTGK